MNRRSLLLGTLLAPFAPLMAKIFPRNNPIEAMKKQTVRNILLAAQGAQSNPEEIEKMIERIVFKEVSKRLKHQLPISYDMHVDKRGNATIKNVRQVTEKEMDQMHGKVWRRWYYDAT